MPTPDFLEILKLWKRKGLITPGEHKLIWNYANGIAMQRHVLRRAGHSPEKRRILNIQLLADHIPYLTELVPRRFQHFPLDLLTSDQVVKHKMGTSQAIDRWLENKRITADQHGQATAFLAEFARSHARHSNIDELRARPPSFRNLTTRAEHALKKREGKRG